MTQVKSFHLPLREGTLFKYLHFYVKGPGNLGGNGYTVVWALRSNMDRLHRDVEQNFREVAGLSDEEYLCYGGGIIEVDAERHTVDVFGRSMQYGRDSQRAQAVELIAQHLAGYTITSD